MARKLTVQATQVVAGPLKGMVKTSLLLPASLHWRLTTIAAHHARDRSDYAAELLNKGLARNPIDKKLRELGEEPVVIEDPDA